METPCVVMFGFEDCKLGFINLLSFVVFLSFLVVFSVCSAWLLQQECCSQTLGEKVQVSGKIHSVITAFTCDFLKKCQQQR